MRRIAWVTALIVFVCGSVWAGGFDVELLPLDYLSIDLHLRPGEAKIQHTGNDTFSTTGWVQARYFQQQQQFDLSSYTRIGLELDYDSTQHSSFFSADIIEEFDVYQYLGGYYYIGSSPVSPRFGMEGDFRVNIAGGTEYKFSAAPYFGIGRLLDASHYVKTYLAVKSLGVEYLARSSYTRIAGFSAQKSGFIKPFDWAEDLEAYRLIDHSVPGMFDSIHVKYMLDNVVGTNGLSSGFQVGLYPKFIFDNTSGWNARAALYYLDAVIAGPFAPVLWYRGSLKLYDDSLDVAGNSFSDMFSGIADNWIDIDDININTAFDLSWFLSQRFRVDYGLDVLFKDVFNSGVSDFVIENQVGLSYRFASHTSGFANIGLTSNSNSLMDTISANWGLSFKIL